MADRSTRDADWRSPADAAYPPDTVELATFGGGVLVTGAVAAVAAWRLVALVLGGG